MPRACLLLHVPGRGLDSLRNAAVFAGMSVAFVASAETLLLCRGGGPNSQRPAPDLIASWRPRRYNMLCAWLLAPMTA